MAIISSGRILISNVTTELAVAKAGFRLTSSASRTLAGVPSGRIKLSNFYGKANIRDFLISSNRENLNLFNEAGNPTVAGKFRFTINGGVTVGQNGAGAALIVGQFPAGSEVMLINNGAILGRFGAPNGGTGGDAIYAAYGNQVMTITNNGAIYGGGGGGGMGGWGGTGGQGGTGVYETASWAYNYPYYGASDASAWVVKHPVMGGGTEGYLYGTLRFNIIDDITAYGEYRRGAYRDSDGAVGYTAYEIGVASNVYTAGGAGGGGGRGGDGGAGQGYGNGSPSAGAGGWGGGAGVWPGGNAGQGGYGGTGGNGGSGGGYGAYGAAGAWGATGNAGYGGNAGGGVGGAGGGGPSGGGVPGYYLIKGGANLTFINNNGIAGRLG